MLLMRWCLWCADAAYDADALMLLMGWCCWFCWWTKTADAANTADELIRLMLMMLRWWLWQFLTAVNLWTRPKCPWRSICIKNFTFSIHYNRSLNLLPRWEEEEEEWEAVAVKIKQLHCVGWWQKTKSPPHISETVKVSKALKKDPPRAPKMTEMTLKKILALTHIDNPFFAKNGIQFGIFWPRLVHF